MWKYPPPPKTKTSTKWQKTMVSLYPQQAPLPYWLFGSSPGFIFGLFVKSVANEKYLIFFEKLQNPKTLIIFKAYNICLNFLLFNIENILRYILLYKNGKNIQFSFLQYSINIYFNNLVWSFKICLIQQ